jgi:hypothetical protein
MSDEAAKALFGPLVEPGSDWERFLAVGFESLPPMEQAPLIDELRDAQRAFIGACFISAMESDRIEHVCPNTPEELLDPNHMVIRFRDDPHA